MVRRVVGLSLAFGFGFLGVFASAADDPKPADWSAWTPVAVWTGDISKLSRKKGEGFVLKVTTTSTVMGTNGRPSTKKETKSYELTYADGALVRWAKLPPKLDDKGKKVERTAEELAELKKPAGAKGYAAAREDLKPGQAVEVTLVRPKELAAKEVQFSDYRIKQVMIVGEGAAPPDPKGKAKAKN